MATAPSIRPVRPEMSPAERQTRQDLAALYRIVAKLGMTDLIYTHISARVPGPEGHFLINAYGLLFEEMTASRLIKIDLDGNVIGPTDDTFNAAGFTIHSAIHAVREDVTCVVHTHTRAGIAVAAQEDGLLPLSQHAARFHGRVAYHDYEGVALDLDERSRLQASLGDKQVMILRNHGLLVAGRSIPDAFDLIYYLERACQAQVAIQSCGAKLRLIPPDVAEHVGQQFDRPIRRSLELAWDAAVRMIDRDDRSWRD